MKFNKIISLVVGCLMLFSCIPALATTAVSEAYVITSGNAKVASFTDDGNGTYIAKSVLDGYTHAGNTVFRYGQGTSSERIDIPLDSESGKFKLDKIMRFTSTISLTLNPTAFNFGTFYYKNGSTLTYPTSVNTAVNAAALYPQQGDVITVDSVVDLNTLTSYFYINNTYVGEHVLASDKYSDATSLKFGNTLIYVGQSGVTAADVELCRVSDVKRTIYPAGTTLASVQEEITDVYSETDITPVSLMTHRFTVTAKSGADGVYNVTEKHASAFHGSVAVPLDTVISSSKEGHVRATFTFTPKVNMYYTANKINVVRYEGDTKIGNDQLGTPTPISLPSFGTNSIKFDAVVNKATGEAKYYVNGNLVGSNTYTATDASATLTAKYLALYTGLHSAAQGDIVAEISNAKLYNYPATYTYADIEAAIKGNIGVYVETLTPATRGNVNLSNDTNYTVFTSKASGGASDAANSRINLKEPIVFATSTDKYVVFSSKIKFTKHTNDFFYNMTLFDGGSNRVASQFFAVQQGDEYVAKAIIDVANKKAYYYMDNYLISSHDITFSQVNLLAFLMNNYDVEKAGLVADEVIFGQADTKATHYTSAYTGTLSDVVANEIGSDVEECSLRSAYYSEYASTDNKTEEFMAENYRLAVIANNFNVEDYMCIIAGYNLDEDGNEILAFTRKIHSSNYIYDAIPKDFDVLKVFLWDNASNPIMKVYYPALCRR